MPVPAVTLFRIVASDTESSQKSQTGVIEFHQERKRYDIYDEDEKMKQGSESNTGNHITKKPEIGMLTEKLSMLCATKTGTSFIRDTKSTAHKLSHVFPYRNI